MSNRLNRANSIILVEYLESRNVIRKSISRNNYNIFSINNIYSLLSFLKEISVCKKIESRKIHSLCSTLKLPEYTYLSYFPKPIIEYRYIKGKTLNNIGSEEFYYIEKFLSKITNEWKIKSICKNKLNNKLIDLIRILKIGLFNRILYKEKLIKNYISNCIKLIYSNSIYNINNNYSHCDLQVRNIIFNQGVVYLIDWENSKNSNILHYFDVGRLLLHFNWPKCYYETRLKYWRMLSDKIPIEMIQLILFSEYKKRGYIKYYQISNDNIVKQIFKAKKADIELLFEKISVKNTI